MKIIQTIDDDYIEILNEKAFDYIPKKRIKSKFTELPDEAKLSGDDLELIKSIDSKLIHLEDKVLKTDDKIVAIRARGYKSWECVSTSPIDEGCEYEIKHTAIEYDVDSEYSVTALFAVDLEHRTFYVALQQSGMSLPYLFEETDDLEYAITLLEDYIENAEDYSDYK